MTGAQLSVARAKDRAAMLDLLVQLAMQHGPYWVCTSRQVGRRIVVTFHGPRGLTMSVNLDGDSPQARRGVFVLSWHGVKEPYRLRQSFAHDVNPYHNHKATDVCGSFDGVLRILPARLQSAIDGSAFQCPNP
jgi:hypothetical protein